MISDTDKEILAKYKWKIKIRNENEFTLTSENGCEIKNSKEALDFLVLEREMDDKSFDEDPIESVLNHFGYEIICESPLEVVKNDSDVFISGEAAYILAANLRLIKNK